jgi:hypothetical protein
MSTEATVIGGPQEGYPPLVRALDGWQAQAVLADPEARTDFFRSLTFQTFQRWVVSLNAVIQPGEPRGYIPEDSITYQTEEGGPADPLDAFVMYYSPAHRTGDMVQQEAFTSTRQMSDTDAAITMLGIINVGVHRLYNAHTRTGAVGRQLLSPAGRGYRGTDEDREAYARLVTDRSAYRAQSLNPLQADLAGIFVRKLANEKAERLGYDGPPIVGVERSKPVEFYRRLPRISWSPTTRLTVSMLATERDFGLLTGLEYVDIFDEPIDAFITTETGAPRLSLSALAESMSRTSDEEVLDIVGNAHDDYKTEFLLGIINCLAHGDESVFGPASRVLDQYRLPKL